VNVVENIFQQGGSAVNIAAAAMVISDPTNGFYPIPPNASPGDIAITLNNACDAMVREMPPWANDLRSYYHTWLNEMDHLMVDLAHHDIENADPQNTGFGQAWYESSADLANQVIDKQSGTGKPIGISTGDYHGQVAIVVTLAGTEPSKVFQGNNVNGAISQYLFHDNQYEADTQKAIKQYLAEHDLPPDTPLIFAGHSQGGMVAQDLASKYDPKTFNVKEVITYGAPDQFNNPANVPELKYYNDGDVVPFATWQLNKNNQVVRSILPPWTSYNELRQHGYNDQQIQAIVGEDMIHVDGGDSSSFITGANDNHGAYVNSQVLKQKPLDFTITGPTEYYSAS
jgi:hypothetical protein